jgi:hypothetical protein
VRDALAVLDFLRAQLVILPLHAQQLLALVKKVLLRVRQRALQLADLLLAGAPLEARAVQIRVLGLRVGRRVHAE